MQFEFIVTVSHLGLKGFCKQLLEQFHSGQFLISRSRFTIEDINLLLLISPDVPRAKYAYVLVYFGTILKVPQNDFHRSSVTEPIEQVASAVR